MHLHGWRPVRSANGQAAVPIPQVDIALYIDTGRNIVVSVIIVELTASRVTSFIEIAFETPLT